MTQPKKFLRIKAIVEMTGMCRASVYNFIKAGKFPKQFHVGGRMVAWDSNEVEQWQLEQIAATREAAPK